MYVNALSTDLLTEDQIRDLLEIRPVELRFSRETAVAPMRAMPPAKRAAPPEARLVRANRTNTQDDDTSRHARSARQLPS